MDVRECLTQLYSRLPLSVNDDKSFFQVIVNELEQYIVALDQVSEESMRQALTADGPFAYFVEPATKQRFMNCMRKIRDCLIKTLQLCYKGWLSDADKELNALLYSRRFSRYLGESYVESLSFKLSDGSQYYRMRDADSTTRIDNCWHVPFNLRDKASTGRYNLLGYPCLYLADSKETCDAELGQHDQGKTRWVGTFRPKKVIALYDLRVPTKEEIEEATQYDLFQLLLNYPLIALCSVSSKRSGFNEEYFMPQLLFQQLLMSQPRGTAHKGVVYSSTKHKGGFNIVLPALYDGLVPPTDGHSKVLMDMLEQVSVEEYNPGQ